MMELSKSEYMQSLKHPALLWLKKHDKSKLPPVDAATQAMFDAGNAFEAYAEALFPEGVTIGFDNYASYKTQPRRTQDALNDGAHTIFQGRFIHQQMTFICDIVHKVGEKLLDLYEIKSSTSAKEEYIFDLAYQTMVLQDLGYEVRNIYVIHVNNEYVRKGNIDPEKITATTAVSEKVKEKLESTRKLATRAVKIMESREIPDISPSHARLKSLDEYMKVYRNLVDVPEGSIYDLVSIGVEKIGELEKLGINMIVDIPDDFELTAKQLLQVEVTKSGETKIKKAEIKEFLNSFEYPLYFLDYETMMSAVPYFDGTRPYQQIPFQYSLHIIDEPGAEPRHSAYLHEDNSNPAENLSKQLKDHIGETGTVITWNMKFEKSCNITLGRLAPEYEKFYHELNGRIVDLMTPFSTGLYAHKDFKGSASIKNVLPVLVTKLSYKELEIQEGSSAQRLWMEAVLDNKHDGDKHKIIENLLEYCKLDSLAMLKIFDTLRGDTEA